MDGLLDEVTLVRLFGSHGDIQHFHRTICTDAVVADAVLEELALRGVDPLGRDHHLALIKESDSRYGQAIGRTFAGALIHRAVETPMAQALAMAIQPVGDLAKRADRRVHEFGYLRGLDGQLPTDRNDERSPPEPTQPAGFMVPPSRSEVEDVTPFGRNQFDQIRRLAGAIASREKSIARDGGTLRAIGVVGSDIYDKLLVLSAVRERFPDKLFFTVDMDARVVVTKRQAATQNLLIASGFGLELHPELQCEVGAYRDGYQASTHLAVLSALGVRAAAPQRLREVVQVPRVFEVGRTRAIELRTSKPRPSIHPPFELRRPNLRIVLLSVMVVLVTVLGLLRVRARGIFRMFGLRWVELRTRWLWGFLGLLALPMVAIAIGTAQNIVAGTGEPAYLAEGVSVWPTEVVRMLAAALSVGLLFLAIARIAEGNEKIAERFFGAPSSLRSDPRLGHFWRPLRWWRARRRYVIPVEVARSYRRALGQRPAGHLASLPAPVRAGAPLCAGRALCPGVLGHRPGGDLLAAGAVGAGAR